jgi:hypothetical protein
MTPRPTTKTTRTGLIPQFDCTGDHPVWIREKLVREATRRSSSLARSSTGRASRPDNCNEVDHEKAQVAEQERAGAAPARSD